MPTTFTAAGNHGLSAQTLDIKADYKDEVNQAMHMAIARAWADSAYKQQLIDDPRARLAEFGVQYPDHYTIEFYDDPAAKVGDWSTSGKNQTAVLRIPIPAAPPSGQLSSDDLESLAAAADDCCCCTGLCTCTGATSQETWH